MERYGEQLLDVCLALHASATGASDLLPDPDFERLTKWLQWRVDNWRESIGASKPFDDAVLDLCRCALVDAERDRVTYRQPLTEAIPIRARDCKRCGGAGVYEKDYDNGAVVVRVPCYHDGFRR